MVDFDGRDRPVNGWGVASKRTMSGVAPAPKASAAHWAELATAAEFLALVAKRAEDETGDRDVREIREGAEAVAKVCRARAHDTQRDSSG